MIARFSIVGLTQTKTKRSQGALNASCHCLWCFAGVGNGLVVHELRL